MKGVDCGGPLQASHVYPTGSWPLLSLYPPNCITLCLRHHLYWWHKSPLEAMPWFRAKYAGDWCDRLEAMRVQHLGRKGMTEDEIRGEWKKFGI